MEMHNEPNDETRLRSPRILPNPLLYVRPSFWYFELKVCVPRSRVCPKKRWNKAGSFARLAFVCRPLCALQMCLTWCVGCLGLSA
jgi:hypothetical protein